MNKEEVKKILAPKFRNYHDRVYYEFLKEAVAVTERRIIELEELRDAPMFDPKDAKGIKFLLRLNKEFFRAATESLLRKGWDL